mgnify:CR=1 FL=1
MGISGGHETMLTNAAELAEIPATFAAISNHQPEIGGVIAPIIEERSSPGEDYTLVGLRSAGAPDVCLRRFGSTRTRRPLARHASTLP